MCELMVGCAAESQNWMENLSKSKESHSHQGTKKYPIDVIPAVKFHMLQPPNVDTLAPGRTSSAANRHFPRSGVSPLRNGSVRFLRYLMLLPFDHHLVVKTYITNNFEIIG